MSTRQTQTFKSGLLHGHRNESDFSQPVTSLVVVCFNGTFHFQLDIVFIAGLHMTRPHPNNTDNVHHIPLSHRDLVSSFVQLHKMSLTLLMQSQRSQMKS